MDEDGSYNDDYVVYCTEGGYNAVWISSVLEGVVVDKPLSYIKNLVLKGLCSDEFYFCLANQTSAGFTRKVANVTPIYNSKIVICPYCSIPILV